MDGGAIRPNDLTCVATKMMAHTKSTRHQIEQQKFIE